MPSGNVTSRGDRREPIFDDDVDRELLLAIVAQTLQRCDAQMLAYCLMGNHYHFVLYTRRASLSVLMQQLNGIYTQAYNRRHAKVGHLFQGRFKAILVDRDSYLLEVCRYVELNPVRAGMVESPGDWPWSSYRAHCLQCDAPGWLDVDGLRGYLLGMRGKNDAADAQAICETVQRPHMRFVPIKSLDQQSRLMVHRARQGFVEQRTATLNRIRGLLSEFGIVLPLKAATVRRRACECLEELPGYANTVIGDLLSEVTRLDERVAQYDAHIQALANKNARIVWALLAKGRVFDPNYVSVKPGAALAIPGPATA